MHGNWVSGAPDVLLDPASAAAEQAERIGAQGLRVLLLGSPTWRWTTRTRRAVSPRRHWSCSSRRCVPTPARPWNTLRTRMFRSK